jgi:hypothetical protein
MAHTTTGKNRNTRSVSNRDQTGDASGAERGLHAEEQRPEPTSGGKSIAEDESCAQNENQPRLGPDQKQLHGAEGKARANKPSRTEQEERQRFTRERLQIYSKNKGKNGLHS